MSTYTLTGGDQAENHAGMQKLGKLADEGFTIKDLKKAKQRFEEAGFKCELVSLHKVLGEDCEKAAVLVVYDGVNAFVDADELYDEQEEQEYDTKAFMYGRVVNKKLRHNICYAPDAQEPDYQNKKGRIVAFDSVPLLKTVQERLPEFLGEKAAGLYFEGNYYYDIDQCGIGYHGDGERLKTVGIRLGNTMPLHFQWYEYCKKPIGARTILNLGHGDLYVMSEKTTGNDWKKRSIKYTLRHAAGCDKCTKL